MIDESSSTADNGRYQSFDLCLYFPFSYFCVWLCSLISKSSHCVKMLATVEELAVPVALHFSSAVSKRRLEYLLHRVRSVLL